MREKTFSNRGKLEGMVMGYNSSRYKGNGRFSKAELKNTYFGIDMKKHLIVEI